MLEDSETTVAFPAEQVGELVRVLGQVLVNADLYGLEHKITTKTMEDAFEALQSVHALIPRLRLTLSEGDLSINGNAVALKNPLMLGFAERLRLMNVSGFALIRGMSADEFVTLLRMLSTRGVTTDGEAFARQLAEHHLEHVETTTTVLREVREDEVVISRERVAEKAQGATEECKQSVEQITAFLKGEIPESEDLREGEGVANDPKALANLIMESAVVRQRQAVGEGEQLGDIVVGCLRRAFSQLSSGAAMKTKKGRRELTKMFTVLEESLLERLRSYSDGSEVCEELQAAADELREELKVDDVVADYLKRRSALESSEKALKRVGDKIGVERLEELGVPDRLGEAGVSPAGWRKLVVRADEQGCAARAPDSLALMLDDLSTLLDRLETQPELSNKVSETLAEMESAVEAAAESAEAKLDNLAAAQADKARSPEIQAEALRLLPEVVQELCQPLSVVNGALDMVVSRRLGQVPDLVGETLELALASGKRMQGIVSRLLDVCGVPDTLAPGCVDKIMER